MTKLIVFLCPSTPLRVTRASIEFIAQIICGKNDDEVYSNFKCASTPLSTTNLILPLKTLCVVISSSIKGMTVRAGSLMFSFQTFVWILRRSQDDKANCFFMPFDSAQGDEGFNRVYISKFFAGLRETKLRGNMGPVKCLFVTPSCSPS